MLMRRRLWLGALLPLLVAGGGYAAFRVATRESSEPASIGRAVDRFRAQPPAARALPPALRGRAPAPGVYVYATRGFEVTHVLGTRRHPYPPQTTIAVTAAPGRRCLQVRWDVLATRWDAVVTCARGGAARGWRLLTQSEGHEFVGHVDRRTYRCPPASTTLPASLAPGATWSSTCTIEGTVTADRGVVVGARTVRVAGTPVETVLLRVRTRVSGDTVGAGTTSSWVLPRSGLLVRRTIANASTTQTIVGGVRYEERATLALTSLRPRR